MGERIRRKSPEKKYKNKCSWCHATFATSEKTAKYCSAAHSQKAYRQRQLKMRSENMHINTMNLLHGNLNFDNITMYGARNTECNVRQVDPFWGF